MANAALSMPLYATQSPVKSQPPPKPNVANVVLGNQHVQPWYPSFYPEELVSGKWTEMLYVCPRCFKYSPEILKYTTHSKACTYNPPGEAVYTHKDFHIRRFDGESLKLFAQNLSLFSKLFLDTKSVFFDVSSFLYYILVLNKSSTQPVEQIVGFFSKEKMSWDNNNLACILVFPPWQRKGLGQILIAVSYELGRRERRFGGPERPLSTLGRKGYISFWCGEICRFVLKCNIRTTVTIQDISDATYILREDLVVALKEMDVLETHKMSNGSCIINKDRVKEWAARYKVSSAPLVKQEAFTEPYVELTDLSDAELSDASESQV